MTSARPQLPEAGWGLMVRVGVLCLVFAGSACGGRAERGKPLDTAPAPRPVATLAEREPAPGPGTAVRATSDSMAGSLASEEPRPETAVPAVTGEATTSPVGSASPTGSQLVILHTNDNWGEALPCG